MTYPLRHDRLTRTFVHAAVVHRRRRVDDRQRELRTIAITCLDYVATGNPRVPWVAFILLPAALVCDMLDGMVARAQRGNRCSAAISIRSPT
jgi:phosphatidylglycerophosphate synthase